MLSEWSEVHEGTRLSAESYPSEFSTIVPINASVFPRGSSN